MFVGAQVLKGQLRRAVCRLHFFSNDCRGGITALTMMTFVVMTLAVGMAIDFMRFEVQRTRLQDALDRGVLAAAGVGNPNTVFATVEEYLRTASFDPSQTGALYKSKFAEEHRKVEAQATFPLRTHFLRMVGITDLPVSAQSAASLKLGEIEVSLALDISGSMVASRNSTIADELAFKKVGLTPALPGKVTRLDEMKAAASEFIDLLFASGFQHGTTVNLVPFAGHVNPGPTVAKDLLSDRVHDYSSCVEFDSTDYMDSSLPIAGTASQVPHAEWWHIKDHNKSVRHWGLCPSDANAIEYFSNDPAKLKERIKHLVTFGATGTQNAMKWSYALLDPVNQPLADKLFLAGEVDANFTDRPLDANKRMVLKVIVLLSDGGTTFQPRPKPEKYVTKKDIEHFAKNLMGDDTYTYQTKDDGRTKFQELCDLAQQDDIVVFTIGYDMSPDSQPSKDLRACASTPMMHRTANGYELNEAFVEVVNTITKLRLQY